MEIQQSHEYATYIKSLGWVVKSVDGCNVFIKPFPIIGSLAKLQRTLHLPNIATLVPILKQYRVRSLAVEPDSTVSERVFADWIASVQKHVSINTDHFLPTKTIRIDVTGSEQDMFRRLSEAKRRAVRKAEKNGIRVHISREIDTLLAVKNRSAGFLGFITTAGMKKLWEHFPEKHTAVLIAYHNDDTAPIGGIFMIFWDGIAYYWIAGALRSAKKLFAPTLLVWEALKLSKRKGCTAFDFVGVWDEREPSKNHEWKGFTKFKEGFGGHSLYYPLAK